MEDKLAVAIQLSSRGNCNHMELVLSPAGHLSLSQTPSDAGEFSWNRSGGLSDRQGQTLQKTFEKSSAEGLLALANLEGSGITSPQFRYWRDFAATFLTKLCQTSEAPDGQWAPVSSPTSEELATWALEVPPMRGAEYLSPAVLESFWQELDGWVQQEILHLGSLTEFLKAKAPRWHQVGRVCFHLAENKRDPDHPFAFLATYAPQLGQSGKVQYQPLSQALTEYAGAKNKQGLVRLLSPVHRASQQSVLVKELVDTRAIYHPLAWTPSQAYRFLKEVPIIEDSGVLVRLPDWWKKRPRPRVGITIGEQRRKSLDFDAMLDFRVQLALGDEELTEAEFKELLATQEGLVWLKGQWVEVNREQLSEALEHWKQVERESADGLSFVEGMRLLAGAPADLTSEETGDPEREWSFVQAGNWLEQILIDLRDPENLKQIAPGKTLKAKLRPYQEVGVNWLSFLTNLGLGACLADDMGLGKTVQIIAMLLSQKKRKSKSAKPSLLVLPASLLANWKSEIERFAPSLVAKFVHPSQTPKEEQKLWEANPDTAFAKTDLVITTYGMLLRQKWLNDVAWRYVILDEAQAIKNPSARQSQSVKKLTAESRIALTGTPVENRLADLWSLFDFLCPGLLGSRKRFKEFVKSLNERQRDRYAPLRRLVQPYILRRLKTDKQIIADLPEKTELKAFCGLTKSQAVLYAKLVAELEEALKAKDGIQRRGLVLAYLMRFKQVCNHPSQLLGDGKFAAKDSGKFARLAEIGEEVASRQEKMLIFTQFREMADPLSLLMADVFQRPGLVLHGGTAVKKRKQLVESFQTEEGPPFFILSLKAGGTGLNLTAASHVVHFDRWWNPAIENQATDRAFRIGQKKDVLVHKILCQGTIEERIDEMITEKIQLTEEVLEEGSEKLLTELSNEELIQLVSLDVERATL
ncbi:MAG: DEAD/DEAH box helicase [Planctomycetaceae bacterium]|nr:DEAD/DEAH box helicase [Planctomycetaceae bacterium]